MLRVAFLRPTRFAAGFARDEGGAVTVEAVIWIPFFFFVLMLITDASMAFFSKAEAYRVIESGNRAFATSRFETTSATATWIENQFKTLSASADATTTADPSAGTVSTTLVYPAREVVLFNTLGVLGGWAITVQAQQYVERAL